MILVDHLEFLVIFCPFPCISIAPGERLPNVEDLLIRYPPVRPGEKGGKSPSVTMDHLAIEAQGEIRALVVDLEHGLFLLVDQLTPESKLPRCISTRVGFDEL
ncbi:hypothetical protein [Nocardiopsis sp. JB363]|uniref:hypothetical protein n=1 Tax=Nocardiopsis sp. JB363 TaxID=1434837 RepID=UPI001180C1B0|nr:hypothetical protein [Nocardiopsis sp. JB363]